jgi:hypothetical protein
VRRPWGHIDRWLTNPEGKRWDLIGTAGFEDRSVSCLHSTKDHLSRALFLRLEPASPRAKTKIVEKITVNSNLILGLFPSVEYFDAGLLDAPQDFIEKIDEWLTIGSQRILVDMSAMPKRFLSVLLRRLLKDKQIEEILVVYTVPQKYTTEPLAEDQAPIRTFQAFSRSDLVDVPVKNIIMGLGYMPFDLTSVIDSIEKLPVINVLFPFPPGSPSFQRNWKLLLNLFGTGEEFPEPIRIDSRDVSYAYDVIEDLSAGGTDMSVLLPFGPKPHSLAMILHSFYRKSEVRYTQPTFYNHEYSVGVRKIGGRAEVYGYAIRLNGIDLYS